MKKQEEKWFRTNASDLHSQGAPASSFSHLESCVKSDEARRIPTGSNSWHCRSSPTMVLLYPRPAVKSDEARRIPTRSNSRQCRSSPTMVLLLYPCPVVGLQEYSREVFGIVDDQLRTEKGAAGETDGAIASGRLYGLASTCRVLSTENSVTVDSTFEEF